LLKRACRLRAEEKAGVRLAIVAISRDTKKMSSFAASLKSQYWVARLQSKRVKDSTWQNLIGSSVAR